MSMKYKLALCVLALLAVSAAAFAADVPFYPSDGPEAFNETTPPAYTLQGNWGIGIPAKGPNGPVGGFGGVTDKCLAYNLNGDYGPNISTQYAITPAIDCTGKIGVKLNFLRWLGVQDSNNDQATIWVSNDNATWTRVYLNPSHTSKDADGNPIFDGDVVDTGWVAVSYDLSSVADNKKTVYVRWGIASDGTKQFAGWSIDAVQLTAASADVAVEIDPAGLSAFPANLVATNADGSADTTVWQLGAAAVGASGNRQVPADPLVGLDPAADSAGVAAGNVIGTVIGGNYPSSMAAPVYLTWGPLDLTGLNGAALAFQRWLAVEDSHYDRVRVEVATNDTTDPPDGVLDAQTIFEDTSSSTLKAAATAGNITKVYNVPTTTFFFAGVAKAVTVKYTNTGLVSGESTSIQYTLDSTAATVVWTTLTSDAVNASKDSSGNLIPVTYTSTLPVGAADNKNFAVRILLTVPADKSTAQVVVSQVLVQGVKWTVLYENASTYPAGTTNVFDTAWSAVSLPLNADGKKTVFVRWSVGPSDIFPEAGPDTTNYGGWSLDNIQVTIGSRVWSFVSESAPASLLWGKTGAVTVNAKNAGSAVWNSGYKLYSVEGVVEEIADPGNPGATKEVVHLDTAAAPIDRWGVAGSNVAVSGTVASLASYAFNATVTAPLLSSVGYAVPVVITAPGDDATSLLNCNWDVASSTPAKAIDFVPTYLNLSIANKGVQTSRFAEVQPGQAANWARYWIEELAGRAPIIVQGYPDGTYRPAVNISRDQIAVFIARAAQLSVSTATGAVFHDIPRDYWAAPWIEACASAKIVSGFPDGSYQPMGLVTRDAMTKYIALGAGYTVVPAPATMDAAGWFSDVQVVDDPATTDKDERNAFRDYINTCFVNNVVQGFGDSDTHPTFRPALNVTRDQLAVFVWRAFMRDNASAVVLGGPGITAVNPVEPVAYYGYTAAPTMVQAGDQYYAYITLDAVRLAGANLAGVTGADGDLDVNFALKDKYGVAANDKSFDVSVDAATLAQWIADTTGASATGEPYKNVAVAIDTAVASQGDWNLVVSVEGNELARQTAFSVVGDIFRESFETDPLGSGWILYGQPQPTVVLYPGSVTSPNADLYLGASSVQLQNTQQIVKQRNTSGLHNLSVTVYVAGVGLGSSDAVLVDWSKDYGTKGASATWTNVYNKAGSAVPTKLTKVGPFSLPNGDPKADPVVIGADDNPNFAIRLSVNAGSATPKVYFDDLVLRGT